MCQLPGQEGTAQKYRSLCLPTAQDGGAAAMQLELGV